jgi:glycosyltransferase involved in cell wall biosynthesis
MEKLVSDSNSCCISIVIPCRNEDQYIKKCLESVLQFEHSDNITFEVLVLDGMSTDNTAALVKSVSMGDDRVRLIPNPGITQAAAVNLALLHAKGEWVMRLDAHAIYPHNYLRLCLDTALASRADNVGGIFITRPGGPGYGAQLVQALTTHKFGVGDSGFRVNAQEDWADTVPYGFYRRNVFERIGRLDERLVRAQDYEFNRRIIASGGKIRRNPQIHVYYYNQPTLTAFYRKQFFLEAPYNAYMWYLAPYAFAPRHAITGVFALGFVGGLLLTPFTPWIAWPFAAVMALYLLFAIVAGLQQAWRYRRPLHAVCLPPCFFLFHFIHGLGVLAGLLRLLNGRAPFQRKSEPWPGAGRFRAWPPMRSSAD